MNRAVAVGKLPEGFHVRLNPRTKVYDGGRTLVGGAPPTAAFLTETAGRMLDGREIRVHDAGSRALADRLLALGMADPVVESLPSVGAAEVTVVIPVHDRPRQLDLLLRSVPDRVRTIVVDDCSTDPATIASVAAAHGADLVRHQVNRGPAAARNTGLEHVRTPYVAFVDSDIVLEPDTLAILLRHFHDPKVALVAPRILGRQSSGRETWITRYENGRASLDLGRYPALVKPRAPVAWLPSACVVARVAALGDGFDAGMRVGEDVDLVWRLAQRGWRVRYEPEAAVHHENRPGLVEWWTRKLYYGTGAQPLAERHGSTVAPAVLSPWAAMFAAGVLLQRRWSLAAGGLVALSALHRIAGRVGASDEAGRIALRLTSGGAGAAMIQTSALMLRHWWPAAAAGSVLSRRLRRAVVTAAIVDSAIEYARTDSDLDPLRFAVIRRLDDVAYGTGVWLGAFRRRSVRCLMPDFRARTAR
ncbi:MAG TPA: mycofactocin biosynthesis glycosyltransferase MftF [Jiangellaceae bacterium]